MPHTLFLLSVQKFPLPMNLWCPQMLMISDLTEEKMIEFSAMLKTHQSLLGWDGIQNHYSPATFVTGQINCLALEPTFTDSLAQYLLSNKNVFLR